MLGIDKFRIRSKAFIDVKGQNESSTHKTSKVFTNVFFDLGQTYSNSTAKSYLNGHSILNTQLDISSPSNGTVNLAFDNLNVLSSNTNQYASQSTHKTVYLNVSKDLALSYTKNISNKINLQEKMYLNVLSTNSEYNLTISLNDNKVPEVSVYYPNTQQKIKIEFSDDDIWT